MSALNSFIENAVADTRFRIGGGIVAVAVALGSMVLGVSHPTRKVVSGTGLPEVAYNIPLLRSLPDPAPMKAPAPVKLAGRQLAQR